MSDSPNAETLAAREAYQVAIADALAADQAVADSAAARSATSTEELAAQRRAAHDAEVAELEALAASVAGEQDD